MLSEAEIEHFVEHGYVRLTGCFSRELAETWTRESLQRLFCDPQDVSTWPKGVARPPSSRRVPFDEIAPRAWQAACDLVGGEGRVRQPCTWGDSFIINFGLEPEWEWAPPSPEVRPWHRWHKDGDFFRHFLDSPEQGLLVVAIFSDLESRGGGTFIACDSVGLVTRYLAGHPEGLLPGELPSAELVTQCREFLEITGSIGDVLLLHPFMLHSKSVNMLPKPRFLINPPVHLNEPLCFARVPGDPYSPVERAVLRALGAPSYDFKLARPREAVVPARLQREKAMWEERARTAEAREAPRN